MFRLFLKIITGIAVSMFLFPFSFKFLPGFNTKMMLAFLGGILYLLNSVGRKGVIASPSLIGAALIASVFSFVCFYSAEINHTDDYSYATYITSFFVWIAAAYAVCQLIKLVHKEANIKYLTFYLAGVCFVQCVLVLLIDNISAIRSVVDALFVGGYFYQGLGRLYGIGAALDPAGVRFTVVLIMMIAVIVFDQTVRKNRKVIFQLMICYFTVAVVGNMTARTTSVGLILSLFLLIIGTKIIGLVITSRFFRFYAIFFGLLLVTIIVAGYLYNTNAIFHDNLRFAFEGFFNWMEEGRWYTSSTDILTKKMWVWPQDAHTWTIGSGWFGGYRYSTDVGYCRFILYCGLVGFSIFSIFFIYNGLIFYLRDKAYRLLFLFLIAVTFIIWRKVSTDIFQFYALFYCLDYISEREYKANEPTIATTASEKNLIV